MNWFRSMEISASGLTAERLRMDVIANNLANANSTRGPDGLPFRRREVILETRDRSGGFAGMLTRLMNGLPIAAPAPALGDGVRVARIIDDPRPFRVKFDPTHPDADANGYVQLPNVDPITEMVDLMTASRAYEANVTALNAAKTMAMRALEIGR